MVELANVGVIPLFWDVALRTAEAIVGALLVLVLPGYAITASWPWRTLETWERAVLSLALSITVAMAGGLVLNWTPFGLQAGSWAAFLAGVTLLATAVALLIRRRGWTRLPVWRTSGIGALRVLPFGLAALVATGAVTVAYVGAVEQPAPGYTELWILPTDTTNDNSVRLGIMNMEAATTQYRLVLAIGEVEAREWPAIQLRPHEQWQSVVGLPGWATSETVSAVLYRLDAPKAVYRLVRLRMLPGQEPSP